MYKKLLAASIPIALGLFLVFGLLQGLNLQQGPAAAPAGQSSSQPGGALSPERVAYYQALLEKATRTDPYRIAPAEDTVASLVAKQLGPSATDEDVQTAIDQFYADFHLKNNKNSRPNPLARLGRMKQLEIAEGKRAQGLDVSTTLTGTPEVLTVMVNFSGSQTFSTADPVQFNGICLTDTTTLPPTYTVVVEGPQFNQTDQPDDNWSIWIDPANSYTGGFTKQFFDLLMFSTTGYTQTMRPELENPWTGGQGFNYSGVSFRNWYAENSRGVYVPTGAVEEVTVPQPVSYFGASACVGDDPTDDSYWGEGRPSYTIAISAAEQINAEMPGFDWTVWDQEDIFDYNNNGNFAEPDGYVDHFFLIEAGTAEGGELGEFLVWPHSSDVNPGALTEGPTGNKIGGFKVSDAGPLGGVWIRNYTISDETGGLGVLVHEYGHDLGLPDNYSYFGPPDSNPGLWDVMDSGSYGGGLGGMRPVHMTIWDKFEPYLGWNNPVVIDYSNTTAMGEENALTYTIGQQSKPPTGTIDGLEIKLPEIDVPTAVQPYSGTHMWWSNLGDDRNESIARTFAPAAGESVTITTQMAYDIEQDFDYLYWEISTPVITPGVWLPLDVFSGTLGGEEITTDDNPEGPNVSGNGITGSSPGWITATAVITPGQIGAGPVTFRLRYQTDAAVQQEGVFIDNFLVEGSTSGQILFDDAESGDQWTHMSQGIYRQGPWVISDGTRRIQQNYFVEWRNSGEGTGFTGVPEEEAFSIAGFDMGLNRMYWIDELDENGNLAHVDRFFQHTPGMVVWYNDQRYTANEPAFNFNDFPSRGPKGRVQAVDANPDSFYVEDEAGTRVVTERRSAFDAAFTLDDRPPFTLTSQLDPAGTDTETMIPGEMADPNFRDRIGSFPGRLGGATDFFWQDFNAGVVLPTKGNVPYGHAWPFVGYTGNPGLNAYGVNLEVVEVGENGTYGVVKFWIDDDTVFIDKQTSADQFHENEPVTHTIQIKEASNAPWNEPITTTIVTSVSQTTPFTYNAVMLQPIPTGAEVVSLTLSGNGWVFTDTASLEATNFIQKASSLLQTAGVDLESLNNGSMIMWAGTIGGRRIDEPDAVIHYSLSYSEDTCFSNAGPTLYVNQETITDTFRNNGEPFLWPKKPIYQANTNVTEVCTDKVILRLPYVPQHATP